MLHHCVYSVFLNYLRHVRLVRNLFTVVCNGFWHATACVMCVSLSLYYDVKFGGSHYVMHFLVLISYRYINYMCAFKLPVDQEYAIRQSFAAFLLLTPLFFSEFLGSNDKGMTARAYIGWEAPVASWGWQAPVARGGATGPLPRTRDLFAISKKIKITFRFCRPWLGRQDPFSPPTGRPGVVLKYFKTDIYF